MNSWGQKEKMEMFQLKAEWMIQKVDKNGRSFKKELFFSWIPDADEIIILVFLVLF